MKKGGVQKVAGLICYTRIVPPAAATPHRRESPRCPSNFISVRHGDPTKRPASSHRGIASSLARPHQERPD